MIRFGFIILLFISMVGFIFPARNNFISEFNWLNGSWKMNTKKGVIIESWIAFDDSTMHGKSIMVKNGIDSVQLETIALMYRNSNYYFIPTAEGQNNNKAIAFKITSFDENSFVAENPEHDFPKRIVYRKINSDSIHAFIDGGSSMPEKKSDFYYSRIK